MQRAGQHTFAHQTTYGISERILGAVVAVHGDDKGLMLPPAVAPYHAVIVPILFKGKEAGVVEAARDLARENGFNWEAMKKAAGSKENAIRRLAAITGVNCKDD